MADRGQADELVGDGLMTVKEVAAFLRLSVASVYALMGRGELSFVKIGRCRRVPRRAVVELATRGLVSPRDSGGLARPEEGR